MTVVVLIPVNCTVRENRVGDNREAKHVRALRLLSRFGATHSTTLLSLVDFCRFSATHAERFLLDDICTYQYILNVHLQ